MTIKKFQGKTEEEATQKAKEELGTDAVIMNVKEIKPKGIFAVFKSSTYEVTAALEDEPKSVIQHTTNTVRSAFASSDRINISADEKIVIPVTASESAIQNYKKPETNSVNVTNALEEKLESLHSLLEKKLNVEEPEEEEQKEEKKELSREKDNGFVFLKMLYGTLLDNEVSENYVNQIMDEIEKVMRSGTSVDYILSNVYQKMILKLGQPKTIEIGAGKPKVVFFIGPTGVGKTTTIAKIASNFKVEQGKKVALMTADTYRIAAAEQLRTYANILDTPITIIYSPEELNEELKRVDDFDLVLVDTAGFSHKNQGQREEVKHLIDNLDSVYEKEVYLVLSATTKYKDLLEIADMYKGNFDFRLIFTKLDETSGYGNIFNMKMYTGADLSYSANGQNVPDDITVFDTQKMVKILLGGK